MKFQFKRSSNNWNWEDIFPDKGGQPQGIAPTVGIHFCIFRGALKRLLIITSCLLLFCISTSSHASAPTFSPTVILHDWTLETPWGALGIREYAVIVSPMKGEVTYLCLGPKIILVSGSAYSVLAVIVALLLGSALFTVLVIFTFRSKSKTLQAD